MRVRSYKTATNAIRALKSGSESTLFFDDCKKLIQRLPDGSVDLTVTSPPYCMGKEYEKSRSVEDFIEVHRAILPEIARITREGGSICWQIGYHVANHRVYPLDYPIFSILQEIDGIILRNRLIWTFGFGLNQRQRFSGRHEVILWFTKGLDYHFDLDSVRTPQKYPGKRHYKGPSKGRFSGNPKGKNPGDIWEIPNVKSCHVEKLAHPCQFPVGLVDRLVKALCPRNGIVFDPFMGSASTGVAAIMNERRFLGAELNKQYQTMAYKRLIEAYRGTAPYRSADRPIYAPSPKQSVARVPEHFVEIRP